MTFRRSLLFLLLLGAYCSHAYAQSTACSRSVQGQIAWNQRGNVNWSPATLNRLCAGAENSREPGNCFRFYTDARLDRGAGGPWRWSEGVTLCAGTQNHRATIDCFSARLRSGMPRAEAISACGWAVPAGTGHSTSPITLPKLRPLKKAAKLTVAPSTWRKTHVSARGSGSLSVAARPRFSPIAALMRFKLEFEDRDHKIRHIAVLAKDRFGEFALGDSDGQDRFSATADWAIISRGQPGTATASGSGRMDLRLQPGPANSTLVLTGFEFKRQNGTDANVRMIGIRLVPEENVAKVWLIDDQGFDMRDMESVGWAALGGLVLPPIGHVIAGAASAPAASPGNMRPYSVTLQYAWIPNTLVLQESSASGSTHYDTDGWRPEGAVALQGFEFVFGNSDHHLHGIGVTLGDRIGTTDRHVMFRDQGFDDPMQWTVSYAVLKP